MQEVIAKKPSTTKEESEEESKEEKSKTDVTPTVTPTATAIENSDDDEVKTTSNIQNKKPSVSIKSEI